jgi:Transglycosylase SLT domain
MIRAKLLTATLFMTLVAHSGSAGDIRRFTDSKGILHISNIETAAPADCRNRQEPMMSGGLAGRLPIIPATFESAFGAEQPGAALASVQAAPAGGAARNQPHSVDEMFQRVYEGAQALNGGVAETGKPVPPHSSQALRLARPGASGSVIKHQDSQGFIHITCRSAEADKSISAAAIGPVPQISPATSPKSVSLTPPVYPKGYAIRCQRDRKGVWRIANNPPPALSPVMPVVPMVQVATADLGRDQRNPVSFLGKLPPELEAMIVEASLIYQLPVSLILAVISNESNFAPQAISPKGAMGLMQLMPGTAASLGVQNPFSPRENILAGCRYFRILLDHFQGSVPLALAAYNAGSQRVISAGYQVPPIKETQGFVTQVMALYYLLEKLSALRL